MESYLRLANDRKYFIQAFSVLFRECKAIQDTRDAIPEALLIVCPEWFQKLERQREEGWTMKNTDVGIKKFEKLKTKIYSYLANRMLF